MPKRVAFDATTLNDPGGGVAVMLVRVAEWLMDQRIEVCFMSNQSTIHYQPSAGHAQHYRFVHSQGTDAQPHRLWTEQSLPGLLTEVQPDLYHAIANTGIPAGTSCPTMLTVHDLIPIVYPHTSERAKAARQDYQLSVERADRIVCISKSTRKDLLSLFPSVKDKVTLNYDGIDPLPDDHDNPLAVGRPYIVYTGGYDYRKNVDILIAGFKELLSRPDYADWHLVLTGAPIIEFPKIKALAEAEGLADKTIFTGYLDRAVLGAVVRDAACSVTVSGYEGFGMPPLEAMTVGCPAIVADNSALSEVVGRAAIRLPAITPPAIVTAVRRIHEDPARRKRLVAAGYRQAAKFSWTDHCRTLGKLYRTVIA